MQVSGKDGMKEYGFTGTAPETAEAINGVLIEWWRPKMELKLKVYDRVSIPALFPERSTYDQGIILNDLRKKLMLTQEEVEEKKVIEREDGRLQWNVEKDAEVVIDLTKAEFKALVKAFKKASDGGNLPNSKRMLELYELVVLDGEETAENNPVKAEE